MSGQKSIANKTDQGGKEIGKEIEVTGQGHTRLKSGTLLEVPNNKGQVEKTAR